jgi:hypothetical protein
VQRSKRLATSLHVAAKEMDAENDVLFLILTSHGSPAGLCSQSRAAHANAHAV